jgi:Tol biopolymer transport system component
MAIPKKKFAFNKYYLLGFMLILVGAYFLGSYYNKISPNPFLPTDTTTDNRPYLKSTQTSQLIIDPFTPTAIIETTIPSTNIPNTIIPTPLIVPSESPIGKIVYTCQTTKNDDRNQICIMNADGSNQHRLTWNDHSNNWYASLSPDGNSIVFSSNQSGTHEIYEMDIDGNQTRLTSIGELYAPEISPDGLLILFNQSKAHSSSIFLMNRDGSDPHSIYDSYDVDAVDPTWSPDGERILFALGTNYGKKLYTMNILGSNLELVSDKFRTRGRSDWSPDGKQIAGYSGDEWQRKIFILNSDGSDLNLLLGEGNVQAPSFSPDGGWVAFTGYIDNPGDGNGCEIYIMRLRDKKIQKLTNNDYCDWQPRWGR